MKRRALVLCTLLTGALVPAAPAIAEPKIAFLNPSGYTNLRVLSDKPDSDDEFHLVAWAGEVPANPIVEFELQPPANVGGNALTFTATRVGNDTFEHFFEIPDNLPDADGYTLEAILYSGQEQVANQEQLVRINQSDVPPPATENTLEITEPANGAQSGFFKAADGKVNTIIDVETSEGTRQVRGFYSTASPGSAPEWKPCGSGRVTDRAAHIRCTLEGGGSSNVTAIAAVANNTPPPGDPQAVADAAGDAHRIAPYDQIVSSIALDPASRRVEIGECFEVTATALDQNGDEVANVNLDVHATGPNDQLQFGTLFDQTGQIQQSDDFQAPDKGAHSTDDAINCSDEDALGKQGDHNRPGLPDTKHIESVDNTSNVGQFGFVLRSADRGGTQITAWADIDNDDLQDSNEAAGGGGLGWGDDPPPPQRSVFLEPETAQSGTGDCQRMVLTAKEGGTPLSGVNVDVHASGPDNQVDFCTPAEGSGSREPDAGEHTNGRDADGTAHLEGETDSSGNFVFGVISNNDGATNVTGWLDSSDDDVQAGDEPADRAQIAWGGRKRSVSSRVSIAYKRRAFKGVVRSRVAKCRSRRQVTIRQERKGRDRVVGSDTTDKRGRYSVRTRARGRYYATATKKTFVSNNGDTINCRPAKSRTIRA